MLNNLLQNISTIYIAYGATDFRKQIRGLSAIIKEQYDMDPYSKSVAFIFCNRRRTSIKVLCYDKNRICTCTENIIGLQ